MGFPKGRRRITIALAALLAAAAVAVTVYRVLAPAEVSTVAQRPYPSVITPAVGVVGRLPTTPLIVDGRLRVYATTRQVYADQPANGRFRTTPYWSYRRWPAQLQGVVATGTTVVSRWSDGKIVALDARTGRVTWRADGPPPADGFTARRTGAAVVWEPQGLYVARAADDRPMLIAGGEDRTSGFELAGGRRLWQFDVDPDCRTEVGTTGDGRLVAVDGCAGPATVEFRDAATGAVTTRWRPSDAGPDLVVTPVGCLGHRSQCRGLRTAGPADAVGRGWLVGEGGEPVASPALDRPDAELAGEYVIGVVDGGVAARSARTGEELWRRADIGTSRIIAQQPGRVHLLTEENELVTLDPTAGAERSRFPLTVGKDGTEWAPGLAYAADGYLAVERLREPVDTEAGDQAYFLTSEPIVLAAT